MRRDTEHSIDYFSSVEHYLSALLERKDYADAVKYFEHQKHLLDGMTDAQAASIYLLATRAYARSANYPIALKTARLAQNSASKEGDSILLAEIFMAIANILRDTNQFGDAEKSYRDAESIFRRNDSLEGQSRALNMLAGLYFKQSDYKNSLTFLMEAIEIARKIGDKKKLAFMMGNIGRIQTFIGNFKEATKHLLTNIELSEELGDGLETARALLSLGYVHMKSGEYDKANEAFERALPLINAAESHRDEVIYLTYKGELNYLMNNFDEAEICLLDSLSKANAISKDSTLAGRTLRHLAELELRQENYTRAQRYAARSKTIMEQAGDKVELGALMKINAIITAATDNSGACRKLYRKAIEMLDDSRVRFEKVEALVAAGKCEQFSNRQRLTYLFRAEEFYSRYNLKLNLEEVERLISRIETSKPTSRVIPTESGICDSSIDYVSSNEKILQFKKQLPLLAYSDLPLLLTGETGVGKDHMARYFHHVVRPGTPYVAVNCAAFPESLLESELFGYHKGAFTGADQNKIGLFLAANGGVLFLDEIGDMPLNLQTKILGVLENRSVTPLGQTGTVALDIKLVAATNRNLEEMVEQGTFRRDLYYRLSGLCFEIPPLRKRKEDIQLLLKLFMERAKLTFGDNSLPSDLVRQFIEYDWPGNTRELFNKVKRLDIMTRMVADGDLAELSRTMFSPEHIETGSTLFERVEQFERKILVEAMLAASGNKSEAARILGIHEATVRTKLKRYDISLSEIQLS